jgi:hypothetical protein
MIQAGKHRARAIQGSMKFGTATTGTEQVALTFEFLDERLLGQEITWFGNFANEQGEEITLKALQATGWATDDLCDQTGIGDVEVQLVIEIERDNEGKDRAKVKWVNKAGGSFAFKDAMSEGKVMSLAERVRGRSMKLRAEGGAPAAASGGRPAQRQQARAPQRNSVGEWDGTGPNPHGEAEDIPF